MYFDNKEFATVKNLKNALSHYDAASTEIWLKNIEVVTTKHHCEDAICFKCMASDCDQIDSRRQGNSIWFEQAAA